ESLLHPHLADTAAGRARDGLGARLGAAAVAGVAGDLRRHLDGDLVAGDRPLEVEAQLVAEVGTAKHLAAAAPPGTEDVAEHVAEDVGKAVRSEAAGTRAPGVQPGMAVAVVGGAFLGIGEDFVGFTHLAELGPGVLVVLVPVGVILHRETAIRLLHLLARRRPADAQNFVIVAFRHTSLSTSPSRVARCATFKSGYACRTRPELPGHAGARSRRGIPSSPARYRRISRISTCGRR